MAPQYFQFERLNQELELKVREFEDFSKAIADDLAGPVQTMLTVPHWLGQTRETVYDKAQTAQYIKQVEKHAEQLQKVLQNLPARFTADNFGDSAF